MALKRAFFRYLSWLESRRAWLVHRIGDAAVEKALKDHARGLLVDIGCGSKYFSSFTRGKVGRHLGIDHPATLHGLHAVDAAALAYALPLRSHAAQCVLMTAVLEHLEEPGEALAEAARILEPGCRLILTAPLLWHVHEAPRDFFRYTEFGLRHLVAKAGLTVEEVTALSGFWTTFGQLLSYQLWRLQRRPWKALPCIPLLGWALQALALFLDRLDKTEAWTWMYLVVARKPIRLAPHANPEMEGLFAAENGAREAVKAVDRE